MKRQILILTFTFFIGLTIAQKKESLNYKIVEAYDPGSDLFSLSERTEYTYNSKGELAESINYYWETNVWVLRSKYEYIYNANGKLTETIYSYQNQRPIEWVYFSRSVVTYTDNKITAQSTYERNNGAWRLVYHSDLFYSGNNISNVNSYEWEDGVWTKTSTSTVTYNSGKISKVTNTNLDNGIWSLSENQILIRNVTTGKIKDDIYQDWIGNEWVNYDKTSYSLDANGNRLSEVYSVFDGDDNWIPEDKIDYTYDNAALISNYNHPFIDESSSYELGIEDMPFHNKVLTSIESDYDNPEKPQRGNAGDYIKSRTSYYYSDSTMGLNDLSNSNFVTVYPNPVKNTLNIKLKDQIQADASLFDMNGRLVLEQKIQSLSTSLHIETLNSGIYVLKIRTPDGFASKRITKN